VGAIIVFQPGQAGADLTYGHVAIVEQAHGDGSITISESNAQGLGVISNRTLTDATQYTYIH
jgi:surface antigen